MKEKMYYGGIYHICNKSIANYAIFESSWNARRFIATLDYYNHYPIWTSFSIALKQKLGYEYKNILSPRQNPLIKILSYCIMPDHYHLLFRVVSDQLISKYINDIENSYTRYFNLKYHRKGPLWQSSYRCVLIKSDEQLLHTSRYIHLNPTTNGLVKYPEDWPYSSYNEIISDQNILESLNEISIRNRKSYQKFVEDNLDYQKSLKHIKKLMLD